MRAATSSSFFLASLLLSSLACAQTPAAQTDSAEPPAAQAAPSGNDRHNQRIERIHHEDKGSQINELRVGGETKNITVQPKTGNFPAYEVAPTKPGKDAAQDGTEEYVSSLAANAARMAVYGALILPSLLLSSSSVMPCFRLCQSSQSG